MSGSSSLSPLTETSVRVLPAHYQADSSTSFAPAQATDPNEVILVLGGKRLTGWQGVQVLRGIEVMPGHFAITMTDPDRIGATQITGAAGTPCQLLIGSDTVITGYVDSYTASIRAGGHQVQIIGRSLCQDLVDCSIDETKLQGMQVKGGSIANIATQLAQPYGVPIKSLATGLGLPIPQMNLNLGETPYEVIERIARYEALLVHDDETGALVLDAVGTTSMASGFAEGVNIEAASVGFAMHERFSDIVVYQTSVNAASDVAPLTPAATAKDTTVPRYRRLVVISEQVSPGMDFAAQRARWEIARRYGRSQAVQLTTDTWRDSAGKLWSPNMLAPIDIPHCRIAGVTWLIAQVTFRRGSDGTHADLVLMPPGAFQPTPTLLQPFDTEVAAALSPGGGGSTPGATSTGNPFAANH